MKYIIFGDGIAAASLHYLLKRGNYQSEVFCLIRPHGGSLVDKYDNGIYYPDYGPHYLHTDNPEIIQLLGELAHFDDCQEDTRTRIKYRGTYKDVNGNMSYSTLRDIYGLDTYNKSTYIWLSRKSERLKREYNLPYPKVIYDLVIKDYTEKCWVGSDIQMVYNNVLRRIPFTPKFLSYKNESRYNKVPIEGWSAVINTMLYAFSRSGDITLIGRDEVKDYVDRFYSQEGTKIIYCLPIDLLVKTGARFYTRKFSMRSKVDGESYMSASTYITDPSSDVVRVVDIDLLHQNKNNLPTGMIMEERIKIATEFDHYVNPIMTRENLDKIKLGKDLVKSKYPDMIIAGRVAKSSYSDIDDALESSINTYQYLTRKSWRK